MSFEEEVRKRRKVAASKMRVNLDSSINIEKFTLEDFHSVFSEAVFESFSDFNILLFNTLINIEIAIAEALFKRDVVDELTEIAADLLDYDKK